MANQEQLAILKQGVETWNQWRKEHTEVKADLSGVNLSGANLRGADLRGVDLSGALLWSADFSEADLSEAFLNVATLVEANLSGATLVEANLGGTILGAADLRGADLRRANLVGADLSEADLRGASLSKAFLWAVNLSEANLSGVDLSGVDLSRAVLVETNLTRANLTHCSIYGVSVWNVELEGAIQDSLVITRQGEPAITVDDLEVAQFIYLLLNHEKLRNVLNAVTQKGVLILGRFGGGGLEVLQAIAAKLREEKYLPIIFDFERPQDHDYTETVKTLVGLARFVIVDLSGPSVPQELSHTVPFFNIPFVPIIEKGRKSYAMCHLP